MRALILLFIGITGCKVAPHKLKSDSFKADPVAQDALDLTQSLPLVKLAPEQVAAHFQKALGFKPSYKDYKGNEHDLITESYAVALGGVDFEGAFKRDPVAKVTTLLICRTLAWQAANQAVYGDIKGDNKPPVFIKSDVQKDRPVDEADNVLTGQERIDLAAGEAKWQDQVSELYWRLYSRPPTKEEMTTIKTAFTKAFDAEQSTPRAWVLILYSLLASAEFWNA